MGDRLGPMLTVEEAARLLRIGRTKAYAMAKEWRTSGGRAGLPVVDLGDVLRVPQAALEQLVEAAVAGAATIAAERSPVGRAAGTPTPAEASSPARVGRRRGRRPSRGRARSGEGTADNQLPLFPTPSPDPAP